MFREMRRKDKAWTEKDAKEILARNTSGVLAVFGDDGYPYAVPLNYTYHDGKLYFHSAATGHKLDAIIGNEKVSFAVVDEEEVIAAEFRTIFASVIVFGRARILSVDAPGKQEALEALVKRFSADYFEKGIEEIKSKWGITAVVEIEIDHITAKGAPLK